MDIARKIAAALKKLAEATRDAARRRQLTRLAGLEALRGNGKRALELVAEAEALVPLTQRHAAELDHIRGVAYFDLGNGEESAAAHQRALTIYRTLKDEENLAHSLVSYGRAARLQEHYKIALACYDEATGLFRKRKKHADVARITLAIGNLHLDCEEWEKADSRYRQALKTFRKLRDRTGVGIVLTARADAARGLENRTAERSLREEALPILRKTGRERTRGECARALAELHEREGRPRTAAPLFLEAAKAFRAIGWDDDAADCERRAGA